MPIYRGLAYATLVAVSAFIVAPCLVLSATPGYPGIGIPMLRYGGIILFLAGVIVFYVPVYELAAYGRGTPAPFDPARKLVTTGVYGIVRNPMYLGAILILLGESFIFPSAPLLGVALAAWLLFHVYVVRFEEPALFDRFGDKYVEYVIAVPRWLPRRSRGEKDLPAKYY